MQLFTNNARSVLAAPLAADAGTLTLRTGDGARFPNPQVGDDFLITLYQVVSTGETNISIARCTARVDDVLTIEPGFEGTTAYAYNEGDFVELRLTAGAVLPVRNGALTGALNEAQIVSAPSATAVVIGAARANSISITGTAPISTFDAVGVGAIRRTTFTDTLILVQNPASLRLLGGLSIPTRPGDWATWISLGAGVWQMIAYARADGTSLIGDPAKAPLTGAGTSGTWPISITGTAASLTGVNPITMGGTGATTAAAALAALGAYAASNPAGYITAAGAPVQLGANAFTARQTMPAVAMPMVDKTTAVSGVVTFNVSAGDYQRLQAGGAITIAFSGWPTTNQFEGVLIKMVNWGGFTVTMPTIYWQLPAGGYTTTFSTYLAAIGRASLQSAGTDFGLFWSDNAGGTIYGKLL